MSVKLDGKAAALKGKELLKVEFSKLSRKACLAIIHFSDPASNSYFKGRVKIADEVGVGIKDILLEKTVSESELSDIICNLNKDGEVDGIMIDRPLPSGIDENKVLNEINPDKDVDGCTDANLGRLLSNKDCFPSCTPSAAVKLLKFYDIPLSGKNVLVIGRSINVGKPLSLLCLKENATVTIAHSKTKNIKELCKQAEVIFLCIGKAGFLKLEDINENCTVVDIGINFDADGKLCGDASKDIYDRIYAYSPVPGGVGVMTNVCLMENVLKAYKKGHIDD